MVSTKRIPILDIGVVRNGRAESEADIASVGGEPRVVECKGDVAIGKGGLSAFGYECAGRTLGPQIRECRLPLVSPSIV